MHWAVPHFYLNQHVDNTLYLNGAVRNAIECQWCDCIVTGRLEIKCRDRVAAFIGGDFRHGDNVEQIAAVRCTVAKALPAKAILRHRKLVGRATSTENSFIRPCCVVCRTIAAVSPPVERERAIQEVIHTLLFRATKMVSRIVPRARITQ